MHIVILALGAMCLIFVAYIAVCVPILLMDLAHEYPLIALVILLSLLVIWQVWGS